MPLKPVVKKQSMHRESLPLRLNWIVPMTKGQQLAVSFTYHPGLDDTDVVSASIDQAISKETMKETKEMMKEVVRCNALDRVFLATDYFDASINRVAALVIGMRNVQKAILTALLLPNEKLKELQDNGEFTKLLALQEENKLLPVGAVWDEFCTRNNVPAGSEWFKDIEDYEKNVQLLRK